MTSKQVAQAFKVDPARGLSTDEAQARLQKYGPNSLTMPKRLAPFIRKHLYLLSVPILLLVAGLYGLLFTLEVGTFLLMLDLAICLVFLVVYWNVPAQINGAHSESQALVRRDGQLTLIDATSVVPGDIAILTAGSLVPADGRLCIVDRLAIDEMTLTGGGSPIWKKMVVIENEQARPGQCNNMAYKNTTVTHGYGTMIVTSTGLQTEIGTSFVHQPDQTQPNKNEQVVQAVATPSVNNCFRPLITM